MAGGLRGRHPGSSAVIGGASCVYVCGLGCICGPAAPSAELLSLFGSDPEHRVGLHRRVPFQLCLGVGRGLGAQLLKTEQSSADASVSCDPAAKAREVDFDFDIRCCSCARGAVTVDVHLDPLLLKASCWKSVPKSSMQTIDRISRSRGVLDRHCHHGDGCGDGYGRGRGGRVTKTTNKKRSIGGRLMIFVAARKPVPK